MIFRFFLVGLIVLYLPASGQNISRIDSLKASVERSSGSAQFDALNDLGFEFRLSEPDSTIYYCLTAYELGKSLKLKRGLSKPLSFIGLAYAYKGDFKSSFDYHRQAIDLAAEQQDSIQLGFCYNNFGRLFFDQGDLTRAYDNLIKSKQIFDVVQDKSGLAYVYRSLSNIHRSQGDYVKALEMSKEAYKLRLELGDQRSLLSALTELGIVYTDLRSKRDAVRCFDMADSVAVLINDEISRSEIKIALAEFFITNDDIESAAPLAEEAFTRVNSSGNIRLMPRANLLMGIVRYRQNRFDEAKSYLNKVLAFTETTYLDLQRDANFYISKVFEKQGDKQLSVEFKNRYLILKESLQSVELTRQIEKLQFQLEIEKRERENEQLKSNEARNDAIIRQQRLENIILIVIIAFVSLLFFVQWRNSKKRRSINEQLAIKNVKIERQREEIAKQNEKLEHHNHELSELNHEKDTLMNIVAHDLKAPLNRIKGLSDLVEMEGGLTAGQQKYLGLIRDSTRAGLDLIIDLLDVNALEVNREPSYSLFDLQAFVEDRVNSFSQYAEAKHIEISINHAAGHPKLFCDQDYLARIIDNLLSNAIKFSPKESKITLSTNVDATTCILNIQDTGPGFSEEDRKFIFQKFRKLSARPTAGESSNGLGLAIVKILVDRLDGDITLNSIPGKGSEFVVRLPLKKA